MLGRRFLPRLVCGFRQHVAMAMQVQQRFAHARGKVRNKQPYLTPPRSIRQMPQSRSAPAPVVYTHTKLKIAIVGRPNVGKSTLFNRLASAVRGRGNEGVSNPSPLVFVRSVVDSKPGVTRDPREASAALSDLLVTVVDTPGLENAIGDGIPTASPPRPPRRQHAELATALALCDDAAYRDLYRKMEAATVSAVEQADIVFFIVDAAEGVTAIDHAIAKWLHETTRATTNKRVMLLANKCDVKDAEKRIVDAYELGFGDPLALSAEQGLGFGDLYAEIDRLHEVSGKERAAGFKAYDHPWKRAVDDVELYDEEGEEDRKSFDDELVVGYRERPSEEPLRQLVVSILGRPNVGKSTLLNRLGGEERSLVGPSAGVTRDAVLCEWKLDARWRPTNAVPVWLVDTAGVRAQTKVLGESLELLSVRAALRAMRHSHVVLVVLDACEALTQQDTKLLDLVVTEGRAAVIVLNKMDTLSVTDIPQWRLQLRYRVDRKLSELAGIELVEMSAKEWTQDATQEKRLFQAVHRAWQRWEKRVPTAQLNRFVKKFNERMAVGGGTKGAKRNRIGVTKFITQKKIRPPLFRLDGSSAVSMNYLRSLSNALRLEFGFHGVPIRVKRPTRGRK